MDLKKFAKQLASLTKEERDALAGLLAPAEKPVEKTKNPAAPATAGRVFFFRQLFHFKTEETKNEGGTLKKTVTQLPSRVIAVNEAQAGKLYWKTRNKYEYLGQSNGQAWKKARESGKSVGDSTTAEYNAMLKNPDLTPPVNNEKTFFRGKTIASAGRGEEIPWNEGLKQMK